MAAIAKEKAYNNFKNTLTNVEEKYEKAYDNFLNEKKKLLSSIKLLQRVRLKVPRYIDSNIIKVYNPDLMEETNLILSDSPSWVPDNSPKTYRYKPKSFRRSSSRSSSRSSRRSSSRSSRKRKCSITRKHSITRKRSGTRKC